MNDAGLQWPRLDSAAPLPLASHAGAPIEHAQWRAAREMVVAATRTVPSLVLVLGAAGTGKTMLMRDLARVLASAGAEVLLQSRGDLPVEPARHENPGAGGSDARRIVLIDEADHMDAAALERLAALGPCAVVLAGLAGPVGAHGADCANAVITLTPLHPAEVVTFVSGRLAQSGLPEDLFDETAVACLAARSGNVPRVLTALINAAVFIARGEDADRVTARHVGLAAGFREDEGLPPAAPAEAAPQPPAGAAIPPAESTVAEPDRAWAAANDEYHQSLARERRLWTWRGSAACAVAAACVAGGWFWFEHASRPQVDYPAIAAALRAAGPTAAHDEAAAGLPANPPPAGPATPPAMVTAIPAPEVVIAAPEPETAARADPQPASSVTAEAAAAVPAPPVPPQPPAAHELPRRAPVRVAVRYAGGDASAAARAGTLAQSLHEAGFMVDSQAVAVRASAGPVVRYFFGEDSDAAGSVLRAAGLPGPTILAKAAPRGTLPAPGTVELFVPSAGTPPQGLPLPVNNAAGREEAPAVVLSKQRLQRG